MKKLALGLMAAAVVVMAAVPAMSATEWKFGGMIRFMTFWDQNHNKNGFADLQGGGAYVKNDGVLNWGTQANTRVMAWMKSDSLEGYVELGYNTDESKVWTREYWGKFKFNGNMAIIIGQQHQLYSMFTSRQAGLADLNLNGVGTAFRPPTPKITFNWGGRSQGPGAPAGFSVALVKPETDMGYTYVLPANYSAGDYYVAYDEDTYIPQIQAAYQYYADTWRVKLAGAYQWTKVKQAAVWDSAYDDPVKAADLKNKNIHTWLVTLDGDISFGPLWLAAGGAVGQNWGNAGMMNSEFGATNKDAFPYTINRLASAHFDGTSFKNTTSWMAHVVAAYQLTEALRFEGGVGFRYDNNDAFKKASKILAAYAQAAYTVAPGFEIVPEIGYIDRGKGVWEKEGDKGYLWYAGAQWNLYF